MNPYLIADFTFVAIFLIIFIYWRIVDYREDKRFWKYVDKMIKRRNQEYLDAFDKTFNKPEVIEKMKIFFKNITNK